MTIRNSITTVSTQGSVNFVRSVFAAIGVALSLALVLVANVRAEASTCEDVFATKTVAARVQVLDSGSQDVQILRELAHLKVQADTLLREGKTDFAKVVAAEFRHKAIEAKNHGIDLTGLKRFVDELNGKREVEEKAVEELAAEEAKALSPWMHSQDLPAHHQYILGSQFSSDSSRVATVDYSDVVMSDVQSGKELWRKNRYLLGRMASFSPDGQLLAVKSGGRVAILKAGTGEVWSEFSMPSAWDLVDVDWNRNRAILVSDKGLFLKPIDMRAQKRTFLGKALDLINTGKQLRSPVGISYRAEEDVFVSENKRWLAVFTGSGKSSTRKNLQVWDLAGERLVHTIDLGTVGVKTIAFSADGDHLAIGGWDGPTRVRRNAYIGTGYVSVYRTSTGQLLRRHLIEEAEYIGSISFAPDGAKLAALSPTGLTILDWSQDLELQYSPSPGGPLFRTQFSPDGNSLLVGFFSGSMAIFKRD